MSTINVMPLGTWRKKENLKAYAFIFPFFAFLTVFWILPTISMFSDSFFRWDGISPDRTFVGLGNYSNLFLDPDFSQTLGNTFVFIVGSVPIGMVVSLGLALLLQHKLPGSGLFRTIFFLPVATSLVASGLIWQWFLNDSYGVLNNILQFFSPGSEKIKWLTSTEYSMISVVMMSIWKDAGYFMIIYIGGLHAIDRSYYEAARIDGAHAGQVFGFITWPLLIPTTFLILVTKIIFSFRTFEQVYAMTKGGPIGSTKVFVYYIWEQAFKLGKVGFAAAASVILLAVVVLFTLIQFKIIRRPAG